MVGPILSPTLTYLLASAEPGLLGRIEPVLLGSGAEVKVVLSAEAVLASLAAGVKPNLILLDAVLPGMPTEQLLAALRESEAGQGIPVVLVVDAVTPNWFDRLEEGVVNDLIPRDAEPCYWRLRIASTMRVHRLVNEVGSLRESELRNAQLDRLTGVYNRDALLSLLFRETDRVQRMQSSLALLLLLFDVDDFGHWNSRLGIGPCDAMLREAVRRVSRLLRSYDLLGRTGKDEFLIVLPGCSVVNAVMLAERLRLEVFSTPFHAGSESIRLSACFGIAQSHGRSPVVVLREAEQSLARARQAGPESIQTFEGPFRQQPAPVVFL